VGAALAVVEVAAEGVVVEVAAEVPLILGLL